MTRRCRSTAGYLRHSKWPSPSSLFSSSMHPSAPLRAGRSTGHRPNATCAIASSGTPAPALDRKYFTSSWCRRSRATTSQYGPTTSAARPPPRFTQNGAARTSQTIAPIPVSFTWNGSHGCRSIGLR